MAKKFMRKNYFVHPSSQIKYIALTILPALVIGLFAYFFMTESGKLIMQTEKENLGRELYSVNRIISQLQKGTYAIGQEGKKQERLKNELLSLRNIMKVRYFLNIKRWYEVKMVLLVVLVVILITGGIFSLLYSHRIAGPLFRLRRCLDMLARGEDIPIVRFRRDDEFKELAEAVENLRGNLKQKGFLK